MISNRWQWNLREIRMSGFAPRVILIAVAVLFCLTSVAHGAGSWNLPDATQGSFYSASIPVRYSGSAPLTFSLSSGTLPAGLSLSANGTVSGTPSVSGSFSFTVNVTNGTLSGQRTVGLTVDAQSGPPKRISVSVSPHSVTVDSSAQQQFTATVQNANDSAVTWTTTAGKINSQGLFTAPSVTIQTEVTITATSVQDNTKQATARATVTPPPTAPLSITTTTLSGASEGSPYAVTLGATGGFPPYNWSVSSGQTPAGINLNSNGTLSGSAQQVGEFDFTVYVTDSGTHHSQRYLKLIVSGSAVGQAIPMSFFGMHIDFPNTPWPSVSFGGQRFWDSDTGWSQINTAQGVYSWSTMDSRINQALANNVDVLYDLARTPVWAQCSGTNKACGSGNGVSICTYSLQGQGGLGQCYPPADLNVDGTGSNQHWIDWVTAVASRYKGEIKYYEIWNEPTVSGMWQGTDAQLVRMTQDARCIVVGTGCNAKSNYTQKGIDPSAQITTPAFVSSDGVMVDQAMSTFLAAGGGPYVDVIAYHGYVAWPKEPEQAVSDAAPLQSVLASNNQQQKPLFSTEGGFGPRVLISDPDQEAAWIARYILLQQSIGLARSYWYAWDAAITPFWSTGSGVETGGTTYAELTSWLVGATLSSPCAQTGTVWQCGYTRKGGYRSLAVWDTSQSCNNGSCTTSTFNVPAGYTNSLDLTGIKTTISGSTVQIGIKPILLENQ